MVEGITITNKGGTYSADKTLSALEAVNGNLYKVLVEYDKENPGALDTKEITDFLNVSKTKSIQIGDIEYRVKNYPKNGIKDGESYNVSINGKDITYKEIKTRANRTEKKGTVSPGGEVVAIIPTDKVVLTTEENKIAKYIWEQLGRDKNIEPDDTFKRAVQVMLADLKSEIDKKDLGEMRNVLNTFIKGVSGSETAFKFTHAAVKAFFVHKGTKDNMFSAVGGFNNFIQSTSIFGIGLVQYAETISFDILTADSNLVEFTFNGIDHWINESMKTADIKIKLSKDIVENDKYKAIMGEIDLVCIAEDGAEEEWEVKDLVKLDKAIEDSDMEEKEKKELKSKIAVKKYNDIYKQLRSLIADGNKLERDERTLLELVTFAYGNMTGKEDYKGVAEMYQFDIVFNQTGADLEKLSEDNIQDFEMFLVGKVLNDICKQRAIISKAGVRTETGLEYLKRLANKLKDNKLEKDPKISDSYAQEVGRFLSTGSGKFEEVNAFDGIVEDERVTEKSEIADKGVIGMAENPVQKDATGQIEENK